MIVREKRPRPVEEPRELCQRVWRAEPHGEASATGRLDCVAMVPHLDEVLLARQSMPVADEHKQRRTVLGAKIHLSIPPGIRQHDSPQVDRAPHRASVSLAAVPHP